MTINDRFVVESDRRVVGIAVRSPGGYRFFASDEDFDQLEGRTFARARALASSVAKISRRLRRIPAPGTRRQPAIN
jgi:hypothetical protein